MSTGELVTNHRLPKTNGRDANRDGIVASLRKGPDVLQTDGRARVQIVATSGRDGVALRTKHDRYAMYDSDVVGLRMANDIGVVIRVTVALRKAANDVIVDHGTDIIQCALAFLIYGNH